MKITRRNPVEFIKYVLLFIKWNPDSPVGNADGYCPPSLSAGNRQFGFLLRVFHCLSIRLLMMLLKCVRVGYNDKRFRFNIQFNMYRLVRF